jgi:hypothetical protein
MIKQLISSDFCVLNTVEFGFVVGHRGLAFSVVILPGKTSFRDGCDTIQVNVDSDAESGSSHLWGSLSQ